MDRVSLLLLVALAAGGCRDRAAVTDPAASPSPSSSSSASAAPSSRPLPPGAVAATPPPVAPPTVFTFEHDPPGTAPQGFTFARTGQGKPGAWTVRAQPGAPSGERLLAQSDADPTDFRFPMAIAGAPIVADVGVKVKCMPVSGAVDRACGLVVRYKGPGEYYVARANALEGNVRFYYVKDEKRIQLATSNAKVTSGAWHELGLDARGDHFEVRWEGAVVLDVHDTTISGTGRVGVWTKADSVTYFDDFTVTP